MKRILEPADVIYDGARDNAASGTWYDWISCGDFITGEGHERHELYSLWVLVLFPAEHDDNPLSKLFQLGNIFPHFESSRKNSVFERFHAICARCSLAVADD